MLIIVDSNEQATSPRIIQELKEVFPNFLVSKLSCGDIQVILDDGSKLAVERKEIFDFLASIGDGRLFRQVENMAANSKYYAVVIEGELGFQGDFVTADNELTNWRGVSVRAAIFAIQWSGCPVFFVPKGCYSHVVNEMIAFVSKGDEHLQKGHQRIVTFPPVSQEVDILTAFPDIGIKRAEALLEFVGKNGNPGSLAEAMCWASAMNEIPKESRPLGWGKRMVDKFRFALGLKDNQYLDVKDRENENKK